MQTFLKSERFQNELIRFNSALEKIPDGHEKEEFKNYLNKLIFEVKKLDSMYLDMVYTNQLSSLGGEIRNEVTMIRKKLDTISKKFEN